jgi:hypothetical protein
MRVQIRSSNDAIIDMRAKMTPEAALGFFTLLCSASLVFGCVALQSHHDTDTDLVELGGKSLP